MPEGAAQPELLLLALLVDPPLEAVEAALKLADEVLAVAVEVDPEEVVAVAPPEVDVTVLPDFEPLHAAVAARASIVISVGARLM